MRIRGTNRLGRPQGNFVPRPRRLIYRNCHNQQEASDQPNLGNVRHRLETFRYRPLSRPEYRAGPTKKVPGRKDMKWEGPDWVDQEATAHRGPDE